jgi:hypothetical protein
MKTTQLHRIVAVLCGIVLFQIGAAPIYAQFPCTPPTTRTWLRVSDTGYGKDTLWFGFDPTATCGVDTHLCEGGGYEPPPIPPAGVFYTRLVLPCGTPGLFPNGKHDYRQFYSASQVDTYKVYFQPTVPPGYPIRFHWSIPGLLAIADSARLIDVFNGFFVNARMQAVDSVQLTMTAISNLLLIRFGAKGPVSVEPVNSGIPKRLGLAQNYPNPFNPTTTFRLALAKEAGVNLRAYNTLGQEVAELVNMKLAAGYHDVVWDGKNSAGVGLGSGVYFVRVEASPTDGSDGFIDVKKVLLMR